MKWNVVKFLNDHHIPYEQKGGGWVNICCPFGHNHKGQDLDFFGAFSTENTAYTCWKCGPMPAYKPLVSILGVTEASARKIIDSYAGGSILVKKKVNYSKKLEMPGKKLEQIHRNYLIKRGLDPEIIEKRFGLLGTREVPEDHRYSIIIPIYYKRQLISYQSRDITGLSKIRYRGCSVEKSLMNYKNILYGSDLVDNSKPIIVVEGVFDVYKIIDNTVCTFGTSVTESQIKEMSKFKKVYIFFDSSDKEGQKKAKDIVLKLRAIGCDAERLVTDSEKDPGEMSKEEIEEIKKFVFRL